ncbi:MAG: branched-chain amino acid transport system ATP-binding protein [Subtercola sp.]|nr:branched-chain amino acid transport system ATP-binding protein [Subtercola sp.]
MTALEITGLNVHYGKVHAVRDVDLHVESGEVVVVVGPNGAGKSSLLAALSGLVTPSAGRIEMAGTDITGRSAHRIARLGMVQVPEGRRIFAPLTIEENLKLGAYTVRDRARVKELTGTVLEMFPILAERLYSPAGLLSGGEQQMLAFGRALMADPHTILLDEPSMGLSPALVDRVIDAIRLISERGLSILMVEQNASAAFGVANRVYILDQGSVSVEGSVAEVSADPRVLEAFLGVTED